MKDISKLLNRDLDTSITKYVFVNYPAEFDKIVELSNPIRDQVTLQFTTQVRDETLCYLNDLALKGGG